jgi:hypothetical protein
VPLTPEDPDFMYTSAIGRITDSRKVTIPGDPKTIFSFVIRFT